MDYKVKEGEVMISRNKEEKFSRVLLWRGGVRFYEKGDYIFDVVRGRFIGEKPPKDRKLVVIDSNIFSGHTIFTAIQKLRSLGYQIESAAGNIVSNIKNLENVIKTLPPKPVNSKPIIFICGLPGSGKSFLTAMIEKMTQSVVIKWGKLVAETTNPGLYGEGALKLEKQDPLYFAKKALPQLKKIPLNKVIILDGAKDIVTIEFLAYALGRPTIVLYLETPNWLRKILCKYRRDSDDEYFEERDKLFKNRLRKIRSKSIVLKPNSNDHYEALTLLKIHGINPRLSMKKVPVLFDKFFALESILYVTEQIKCYIDIDDIPEEWIFHKRYVERYPIPESLRKAVCIVASAFRIIDDIIDEDVERRIRSEKGKESTITAFWIQDGVYIALVKALIMLKAAADYFKEYEKILKNSPLSYNEMVKRVVKAVWIELTAEAEERQLTDNEYTATLDREIAFREWIASISGYPLEKARKEAIKAQIKNDLMSSGFEANRLNFKYIKKYKELLID